MTLAAIVFCQIGAVLNCRTQRQSVFKKGLFSNRRILLGIGIEAALICALAYVPFLQEIFNTAPIGLREWGMLCCFPSRGADRELRKLIPVNCPGTNDKEAVIMKAIIVGAAASWVPAWRLS